jgi:ferric-dicitrate binding protein FerR (iron transport regulator)
MREETKRSTPEDDDALIRDVLKRMEVPVDRERVRRAFLQRVNVGSRTTRKRWPRWIAWVVSPQTATLGAVVYTVVIFLYLALAVSDQPIVRVDGKLGWMSGWRASLAEPVIYERNSRLFLKDGTQVRSIDPSMLAISFSTAERRIELLAGTLEIEAAPDLRRPLVVAVGDTEIKATGTRFVVSTSTTLSLNRPLRRRPAGEEIE